MVEEAAKEESLQTLPLWQWWLSGLRAALCLKVNIGHAVPSPWQLFGLVALATAIETGLARLEILGPAVFQLSGWLLLFAMTPFVLFCAWAAMVYHRQPDDHPTPLSAWFALLTAAALPIGIFSTSMAVLTARNMLPVWWNDSTWVVWCVFILFWIWYFVAVLRITAALTSSKAARAWVVLSVLIIQMPVTWHINARPWEVDYAAQTETLPETLTLSQEVFEDQQKLLKASLDAIQPRTPDRVNVFGIVYAPYSQTVFVRESTMVKNLLQERFGAAGHVVQLVNHPSMTTTVPWATNSNLEQAIQTMTSVMDTERDVLVLYFTSHGGSDFKLATSHWPLEVAELTPELLQAMLDKAGIKNRVIAISACYSGGWVAPLSSDDTMVMTAADATHTSYGCGSRSELTFFGRAVFDEQLRSTHSFEKAFHAAVPIIQQREIEGKKTDGFSNPQIAVGKNIRPLLEALEAQLGGRTAGQ
jgi:hypothetical protein